MTQGEKKKIPICFMNPPRSFLVKDLPILQGVLLLLTALGPSRLPALTKVRVCSSLRRVQGLCFISDPQQVLGGLNRRRPRVRRRRRRRA